MSRAEEFRSNFEGRAGKLPDVESYPQTPKPKAPPPDISLKPSEMLDEELSRYITAWASWKAYMDYAIGTYSSYLAALKQEKANAERVVYLEKYRGGEFTKDMTEKHKGYLVEEDERVNSYLDEIANAQSGLDLSKKNKDVYDSMLIRFYHERKALRGYMPTEDYNS